ncbi:SNF2 N and/or DEAD domain containing protein [Asbolus verrucosus]|uniref:SNF2 N and/or DEAD domain containing protein n=1 Tax=Asbolus verrucosus TaxID=1661398 RepID=A0A482VJ86_ASBVE|nr:SNF2 N and/or DEAD domain containing protein [Asbolus verrucosus]
MAAFEELQKLVTTCPTENGLEEEVNGLKRTSLQLHQKQALYWLLWREKQDLSGGLLADDMGLGKTLTMIALVIKSRKTEPNDCNQYQHGYLSTTLVVCPASLVNQWSNEVKKRTKKNVLATVVHHGTDREIEPKRLASYDMVTSTCSIVRSEGQNNGPIFKVHWRRIILDEAHQIRNNENSTFDAIYKLLSKLQWAMTGTPIHNKELDMYSILKFLGCSLILRLRLLCCHPFLVKKENEKPKTTNLLEKMNNLTMKDEVFSENRQSSKIKILLKMLKDKIVDQNDKAIVVSQWTSFLQLIAIHLKNTIKFDNLDGSITIEERANIVDKFKTQNATPKYCCYL